MGSWSTKRRLIYGLSFVSFLAIVSLSLFYNIYYQKPTCSDGRQNGDEIGIDCGGSCQSLCTSQALNPIVLWAKAFNISGDAYTVSAYVENPNINSSNPRATYEFKVYDNRNKLIGTQEGETFIPRNKKFVIFEPGLVFKNSVPKRVEFEFLSFGTWQKDTVSDPNFDVSYSPLIATSTRPRIEGSISNYSLVPVEKVELVGLVSDGNQNVVATSRTYIDRLPPNATESFVFTWPKPFDLGVEACENPTDVALVIDKSTSMRSESIDPPEPFTTVKSVAKDFVASLSVDDRVSVVSFGTLPIKQNDLTSNLDLATESIDALTLSSTTEQTNIGGGLELALNELTKDGARPESKKVIILLTDGVATEPKNPGQPTYPSIFAESVSQIALAKGITVYTIGLGSGIDSALLKKIASKDSHYFFAPNKSTLSGIYADIGEALCKKKPNTIQVIYRILP